MLHTHTQHTTHSHTHNTLTHTQHTHTTHTHTHAGMHTHTLRYSVTVAREAEVCVEVGEYGEQQDRSTSTA